MKIINYILFVIFIFIIISCGSKQNSSQSDEDELVEVEEEIEVVCPDCDGEEYLWHSCSSCGGSGKNTIYTSGTKPKECATCYGTGKQRCTECNGYGYIDYPYCDSGYESCTVCNGSGIKRIGLDAITCPGCKGNGFTRCYVCDNGRMDCSCKDGIANCEDCWGSGRRGQEYYSGTEVEECEICNGSGGSRSICETCEGTGTVIETQIVTKRKSELE